MALQPAAGAPAGAPAAAPAAAVPVVAAPRGARSWIMIIAGAFVLAAVVIIGLAHIVSTEETTRPEIPQCNRYTGEGCAQAQQKAGEVARSTTPAKVDTPPPGIRYVEPYCRGGITRSTLQPGETLANADRCGFNNFMMVQGTVTAVLETCPNRPCTAEDKPPVRQQKVEEIRSGGEHVIIGKTILQIVAGPQGAAVSFEPFK